MPNSVDVFAILCRLRAAVAGSGKQQGKVAADQLCSRTPGINPSAAQKVQVSTAAKARCASPSLPVGSLAGGGSPSEAEVAPRPQVAADQLSSRIDGICTTPHLELQEGRERPADIIALQDRDNDRTVTTPLQPQTMYEDLEQKCTAAGTIFTAKLAGITALKEGECDPTEPPVTKPLQQGLELGNTAAKTRPLQESLQMGVLASDTIPLQVKVSKHEHSVTAEYSPQESPELDHEATLTK